MTKVVAEICCCFEAIISFQVNESKFSSISDLTLSSHNGPPSQFTEFVPRGSFGIVVESKLCRELREYSLTEQLPQNARSSTGIRMVPVETVSLKRYYRILFIPFGSSTSVMDYVYGWVDGEDIEPLIY